ncbi:hypothetical protein ACFS7Z_12910 [Pontibacter toksunensis]|uniref:DUF1275 domain-containing protein n=1 Tax=Pontibacter toksunensis TaxID=1332631 RepID=A0ABW6BTY7_9BACT
MSRNAQRNVDLVLIFVGLLVLALVAYVGYRLHTSERRLIPISVLALIAGVIFESRRLSDKWAPVLLTALGAFVFSFLAFLPGKGELVYNFENHIETFPYWFIITFAFISVAFHGYKTIPKLTEGITLLQSLAIFYWVIDYGFIEINNLFLKSLMVIGLIFSLYSVFHAFTHANLSRTNRLVLSVWSSLIMMLFSIDNIYRVFQNEQIENSGNITNGFYTGLQFFLLGVSCIYIIQNLLMVAGFLPGKGTFFNTQYFRDLQNLKSDHIKRYSDRQVSILHSFFCVLFAGTIFGLNYHYQILPRHTTIWIAFVTFPIVLFFLNSITRRANY